MPKLAERTYFGFLSIAFRIRLSFCSDKTFDTKKLLLLVESNWPSHSGSKVISNKLEQTFFWIKLVFNEFRFWKFKKTFFELVFVGFVIVILFNNSTVSFEYEWWSFGTSQFMSFFCFILWIDKHLADQELIIVFCNLRQTFTSPRSLAW